MNYDGIILELLSRVKELERQVRELQSLIKTDDKEEDKISTADIRDYINQKKQEAADRGEKKVVLRAGDIAKDLSLVNRITMVCNAMKQLMTDSDTILKSPPSGYSTTLEIQYIL